MPHHKSCKKRMKTSEQRRLVNRQERSEMRTRSRASGPRPRRLPRPLNTVYSMLDTQARKGIIPKQRAARLKARAAALLAK